MLRYSQLQSGILRDDVILEGDEAEAIVAIIGGEVLRELDDVLLDGVDIGLHRFGNVHDEDDIDGTALSDAAKVKNLSELAVFIDLDVFGAQITDRLSAEVGQAEVELDAAVGIEVLQTRIADGDLQGGPGGSADARKQDHNQRHERAQRQSKMRNFTMPTTRSHSHSQFSGGLHPIVKPRHANTSGPLHNCSNMPCTVTRCINAQKPKAILPSPSGYVIPTH